MRTLAIGDIHGCLTALRVLERTVPLRAEDSLIVLGDMVDRGPDSSQVLDWAIERHEQGRLIALRGNHEIMMLEAKRNPRNLGYWLEVGGRQTLKSYGDNATLADVPDRHWEFLEQLQPWSQTETHIFVHGSVYANLPLEEQPDYKLYWEGISSFDSRHDSGKTVIAGHLSQKSGLPLHLGCAICIDTWAYGAGWLTCLDVETGRYWQANQRGESRSGWIDELDGSARR